jgi:hypothetical protein
MMVRLSLNAARWFELKEKALPARSSRPSQGEGEVHRNPCTPRGG